MVTSPASEFISLPAGSTRPNANSAAGSIWRTICARYSQILARYRDRVFDRVDYPSWRTDLSARQKHDLMRIEVRRRL